MENLSETFQLYEVLPLQLPRNEPKLKQGNSDVFRAVSEFIEGHYEDCLQLQCMQQIWNCIGVHDPKATYDDYFVSCVEEVLKKNNTYEIQTLILLQGAAALQLFVQNNWTGPPTEKSPFEIFSSLFGDTLLSSIEIKNESQFKDHVWKSLTAIGDSFYEHVKHPEYLWLAKLLLCSCNKQLHLCQTVHWWGLRCVSICQHLLQEHSTCLHSIALTYIDNFARAEPLMTDEKYWYLQVQFHLEVAYIACIYYEQSLLKEHLNSAQKLTEIQINLTGALGKRTQYQAEDKAQLLLQVKSDREASHHSQPLNLDVCSQVPKDIKLDDDVRLESIKYKNEDELNNKELNSVDQAVLLGVFSHLQNTNAVDKLVEEELMAYLTRLLMHPKIWSIQSMVLIHRSKLESKYRRTIERSLKQLQQLVDSFEATLPSVSERLRMFYCTNLPPRWQIEQRLANLLCSVGAIKSALEIYLRLQLWEDIIKCYILLQQRHEAEEVIRKQLKLKETPILWCYLGDVTKNPECYVKAWELSDSRSSRAQKGLGEFYFRKQQYAESVPYFQKSLELNSFQLDCWSNLAFAAMKVENWELTAQAYRRYINFEPDNFEAWNNLSHAYIKLKQKPRAWKALQEALRCNFEDWRIWENYLLVCVDIGEFEEAIKAYHRILDLKEKHVDEEVLSIIVKYITRNPEQKDDKINESLKSSVLQLLGRLTSQVTSNGQIWFLYAKLTRSKNQDSMTIEKVLQYLQKASATCINKPGWERELPRCQDTLLMALQLIEEYLLCSDSAQNDQELKKILSSAKLMTQGVIARMKNYKENVLIGTLPEDIETSLNQVEEKLQQIISKFPEEG